MSQKLSIVIVIAVLTSCTKIERVELKFAPLGEGIKRVYYLKNGKYDGPDSTFHLSGKLKQLRYWNNGKSIDSLIKYNTNGDVVANGFFKHDTLYLRVNNEEKVYVGLYDFYGYDGEVKGYKKGRLYAIRNFKHNRKEGASISYFQNGHIKDISNFQNGKISGLTTYYHPNGNLKGIFNKNVEGQNHGIFQTFYINGNRKSISEYQHGVKIGTHFNYYSNGHIKTKLTYNEQGESTEKVYYTYDGTKLERYVQKQMEDPGIKELRNYEESLMKNEI